MSSPYTSKLQRRRRNEHTVMVWVITAIVIVFLIAGIWGGFYIAAKHQYDTAVNEYNQIKSDLNALPSNVRVDSAMDVEIHKTIKRKKAAEQEMKRAKARLEKFQLF